MSETLLERQLFLMILNLSSALGEMQESLLALADSAGIEDKHKAEVLRRNEIAAEQFGQLISRAKEYHSMSGAAAN